MLAKKNQSCDQCKWCDGFACLKYDVWLDGKIKSGRRKNNFIPILVYGKKYCRKFDRRDQKKRLFEASFSDGSKRIMTHSIEC